MKQIFELLTTILAFGIGLFYFQRLNLFMRLLFIQVSVYLIGECFAVVVGQNNWLYNIIMPVEIGILLYSVEIYFKTVKSRVVVRGLYLFFLIIYFSDVIYFTQLANFAYHAAIAEGFIMTSVYTFLLYELLMNRVNGKIDQPTILVSLGMVVYFACTVPYLCFMVYFQEKDSGLNDLIFQYVVISLASFRYLLIAVAFYLAGRKKELLKATTENG